MASSIFVEYKKFLNRSIWNVDGILTGTTNPGESGPGSNGNGMVLPLLWPLELEL